MIQPAHQFFEIEGHIMNSTSICAIKKFVEEATEGTEDKPGKMGRFEIIITFVSGDFLTFKYESSAKVGPVFEELGKLMQASMA